MVLRLLIVALMIGWHAGARADFHLALETSLFSYRVEAAHPNSPVSSGHRYGALSWQNALALRAGYRWRSGVELGVGSEVGYERRDLYQAIRDGWQLRPCAYGRYVFAGTRVRPFLGALLASEFVGATQADEGVFYRHQRQRSLGFGVEGGAHLRVLAWLTLDAFARFQVLWTRSSAETWDDSWRSDGLEQGFHLTTVGFALSAWL